MPAQTTFLDLLKEVKSDLWPHGVAVNLLDQNFQGPVRTLLVDALMDLQKFVECLQVNNTQVVPQCNTLFKCGHTVTDAPRGRINRLYVIDRINQTTGLEDAAVPIDWCSEVEYRQVEHTDLDKYVSQTLAGSLDDGFWPWLFGFNLFGIVAFPATCQNFWNSKYLYPPPDGAPFVKSPPLPLGFSYPQSATDAPAGRAQWGLWALKGGQIYVAPWIQSTETIIIEWNGLKRSYANTDLIDNDPLLKQAVEAYVAKEYARKYDHDYDAEAAETAKFNEARAVLMDECRKENEVRDRNEGTAARGAALIVPAFVNDAQTATATCPTNTTGNAVSWTVPAGTVISIVSVADANSKAQSLALQTAAQQLNCVPIPITYYNTIQSYTANCGTGLGDPVTKIVAAGLFTSIISQADADQQAKDSATALATVALSCTYQNVAKSFTAKCVAPATGSDVTKTVPAGTYTSAASQATADALALNDATNQANLALTCTVPPTVYWNTDQLVSDSQSCFSPTRGSRSFTESTTVQANLISSTDSQADANQKARNYGKVLVDNLLVQDCLAWFEGR